MNYCWFWDLERSFPGYPQVLVEYGLRKIINFLQFDVADNILGVVNNQVVLFVSVTLESCFFCSLNMVRKHRVAEVVQRHEGPSPKSLDSEENFKP